MKRGDISVAISILAFSFLCYAKVISCYFLSDDFYLIGRLAQKGMFYTWGNSHGGFMRPVVVFFYFLDYLIWGFNPIGYHITNILFHAIAGIALYYFGKQLFTWIKMPHATAYAFIASLLFTTLSSHSEPVCWIAARTDLIAVAFGLLATACFLYLLENGSLLHAVAALILYTISIFTKESMIVLPAIWGMLCLYAWWVFRRKPSTKVIITMLSVLAVLAVYFFLRKQMLGQYIGGYGTHRHLSILAPTSLTNLFHYVLRTFLPALPLRFQSFGALPIFLALLLFAIILLMLVGIHWRATLKKSWSFLLLMSMCYLISLIPVITLGVDVFTTQSERFLYLPGAFACFMLICLFGMSRIRYTIQLVILGAFILCQFFSLQWVNNRWVTAAQLSRSIAQEVSKMDLDNTILLNLPDNFRGAFVFRIGIHEAATLFAQTNETSQYLSCVVRHSLDSVHQHIDIETLSSNIVINIPPSLWVFRNPHPGLFVQQDKNTITIEIPEKCRNNTKTAYAFHSGMDKPVLRPVVISKD